MAARFLHGVAEYLMPVLKESQFAEKGVLTPEEFVAAGDTLVYKCPTWEWAAGAPGSAKPYLPADKQFLITRGVPCALRVSSLEAGYSTELSVTMVGEDGKEDEWLEPQAGAGHDDTDLGTISSVTSFTDAGAAVARMRTTNLMAHVMEDHTGAAAAAGSGVGVPESKAGEPVEGDVKLAAEAEAAGDDDEYADMEDFTEDNLVVPDMASLSVVGTAMKIAPAGPEVSGYLSAVEPEDGFVRTRSYDVSITYDKYYQTPRVYLFGYDESRSPLSPDAIMEDIMQDYANKTVTIEAHPHLPADGPHASIHPCRHAAVMKRIGDTLSDGGRPARVEQYLFIFLKFIQSVIPTVDYDHTIEVDAGGGAGAGSGSGK